MEEWMGKEDMLLNRGRERGTGKDPTIPPFPWIDGIDALGSKGQRDHSHIQRPQKFQLSKILYPAFDQLSGPEVSGHLAKNTGVVRETPHRK